MDPGAPLCVGLIRKPVMDLRLMADQNKNKQILSEDIPIESPSFVSVLFGTFATVFIAELGDKTQIATLLLSAQSGKPLVVFFGAALALICSSLIGVLLGRWLSKKIPAERFEYMAGAMMVVIGIWIGSQAVQSFYSSFKSA